MEIENETPERARSRKQLQRMAAGMAAMVEQKAGLRAAGIGFAIILFDLETTEVAIAYASSGERESMRKALRELLEKMDLDVEAAVLGAGKVLRVDSSGNIHPNIEPAEALKRGMAPIPPELLPKLKRASKKERRAWFRAQAGQQLSQRKKLAQAGRS